MKYGIRGVPDCLCSGSKREVRGQDEMVTRLREGAMSLKGRSKRGCQREKLKNYNMINPIYFRFQILGEGSKLKGTE